MSAVNYAPVFNEDTAATMVDTSAAIHYDFMPHIPFDTTDGNSGVFVKDLVSQYFTDDETSDLGIAIYGAQDSHIGTIYVILELRIMSCV